ncbi:MAG: PIN domain-containing protein [Treponema sp.]|nr:PIN domain-containing protein [Treponema sp.]
MHYILDACALLAFLNDEEGADTIEEIIKQSSNNVSISMSIINLLEVYYGELRDRNSDIAQIVLDMVQHYSIKIVSTISDQVFLEAARLKSEYKVSLADCIGIATAIELGGQFVTSDHHELEAVTKKENISIYWFR